MYNFIIKRSKGDQCTLKKHFTKKSLSNILLLYNYTASGD